MEIKIGKYTLAEYPRAQKEKHPILKNQMFLRRNDGEGTSFLIKELEKVIDKFYKRHY